MSFADYAPGIDLVEGKRTASIAPELFAWLIVALLFLGLMSLAAVQSRVLERGECGPFTIGRSAIGGCDWIGRLPSGMKLAVAGTIIPKPQDLDGRGMVRKSPVRRDGYRTGQERAAITPAC